MKRFITIVSLSVSLVAFGGVASAQRTDAPVITTNAHGDCVTSGSPGNWTISCGDFNPGSGMTVVGPARGDRNRVAADVAPAPAPVAEAAPEPVAELVAEPVVADTAVATETDLDADNYVDTLEGDAGLDPSTPDTDGDGVADGDEGNLYGTDPLVLDTDGDGVSDGAELFDLRTDPLVWNTNGDSVSDEGNANAAGTDTLVMEEAAPEASSGDSDQDRLADTDEAAVGTDPSTPDSDGDGYYDGDEANLGTDPLDPASFPSGSDSSAST